MLRESQVVLRFGQFELRLLKLFLRDAALLIKSKSAVISCLRVGDGGAGVAQGFLILRVVLRDRAGHGAALACARFAERGGSLLALRHKVARFEHGEHFARLHDLILQERHLLDLRADLRRDARLLMRKDRAERRDLRGNRLLLNFGHAHADDRRSLFFSCRGCSALAPDERANEQDNEQRER